MHMDVLSAVQKNKHTRRSKNVQAPHHAHEQDTAILVDVNIAFVCKDDVQDDTRAYTNALV